MNGIGSTPIKEGNMEKLLKQIIDKVDYLTKIVEEHIINEKPKENPMKGAIKILEELNFPSNPVYDAFKEKILKE